MGANNCVPAVIHATIKGGGRGNPSMIGVTVGQVYSKVQKLCIAINKSLLKMLRASVALGKV